MIFEKHYKILSIFFIFVGFCLWFDQLIQYLPFGGDLLQDYTAGYSLRHGKNIYGEQIPIFAKQLTGIDGIENFHPPFTAVLFLPISYLPYPVVFWGLGLITLPSYLYLVSESLKLRPIPYEMRILYTCMSLIWFPFLSCIAPGQFSILLALGGFLIFKFYKEKKYSAGIILSFISMIKLFPLFLYAYFLKKKHWVTLITAIVCFILITIFTTFIVGTHQVIQYITEITVEDVHRWGIFPVNSSLTGIITPLFTKNGWHESIIDNPLLGGLLIKISSILVVLFTFWSKEKREEYHYFTFISAMMLLSPITWSHAFPFLFPAIVFTIYDARGMNRILLIGILLALSIPDVHNARFLVAHFAPDRIPLYAYTYSKLPALGILALWMYLVSYKRDAATV